MSRVDCCIAVQMSHQPSLVWHCQRQEAGSSVTNDAVSIEHMMDNALTDRINLDGDSGVDDPVDGGTGSRCTPRATRDDIHTRGSLPDRRNQTDDDRLAEHSPDPSIQYDSRVH